MGQTIKHFALTPADVQRWVPLRAFLVSVPVSFAFFIRAPAVGLDSRTSATLGRWAYSDGTVFYLARTAGEQESKVRAALGRSVWRQADGKDALFEDRFAQGTWVDCTAVRVRSTHPLYLGQRLAGGALQVAGLRGPIFALESPGQARACLGFAGEWLAVHHRPPRGQRDEPLVVRVGGGAPFRRMVGHSFWPQSAGGFHGAASREGLADARATSRHAKSGNTSP